MSRGGRGGFGGGAGMMNKDGTRQIAGTGLSYDPELENLQDTKPSWSLENKFPPYQPPVAEPPSADEKRIVHHYRTLRARIHDGPFYTILGSDVRISKTASNTPQRAPAAAHFDPFEGQPTYTQRYRKKRNTLPKLSSRPFVKEFFPKELWSTIDPSDQTGVKKMLRISTRRGLDKLYSGGDDDDDDGAVGEDDDAEDKGDDDVEKPEGEEDKDEDADPDQFDEDDEDENDDYNAEQYFDQGDDDEMGGDDGGGEDDY